MQAALDLDFSPRRVQSPARGKLHTSAGEAEKRAAKAITVKSGTQRFAILKDVVKHGPTTQWSVVKRLSMLRSSVCARFKELEEGGWIEKTGKTIESPHSPQDKNKPKVYESLYRATPRGKRASRSSTGEGGPAPKGVNAQLTNPREGSPPASLSSEAS